MQGVGTLVSIEPQKILRPIWWENGKVCLIDQTELPRKKSYLCCDDYQQVARAIREMRVRGAPAIGIAAALGLGLAAWRRRKLAWEEFISRLEEAENELSQTRPTAVNLFWALARMRQVWEQAGAAGPEQVAELLVDEAVRIGEQDVEINCLLGDAGASLVPRNGNLLTHCNAGALATGGYGTALGVARSAWRQGRLQRVVASETRPLLQGARLTAWELKEEGIPVTLVTDNMVGSLLAQNRVDLVVVGADCIAANGDVANKIGTYGLALLAQNHGIPFYVAAPLSTFNASLEDGSQITIEERAPEEVTHCGHTAMAPEDISVWNPAFDVTPAHLVRGIVSEAGVLYPPYRETIARALSG